MPQANSAKMASLRKVLRLLPLFIVFRCQNAIGDTACLPNAVPTSARKNITVGGVSMPLGIMVQEWASGIILYEMYKILASEVLGYNAVKAGGGSSAMKALFHLSGCANPDDYAGDPQCLTGVPTRKHVVFETWAHAVASYPKSVQDLVSEQKFLEKDAAENLGSIGYEGKEGIFVLGHSVFPADEDWLALEWYKTYNASRSNLQPYFDNSSDFDTSELMPCEETRKIFELPDYVRFSGDNDGVEWVNGVPDVPKCWDGVWWRSPTCRSQPDRCIPFITGGDGWYRGQAMAQSAAYDIPLAVAVAGSWSLYLSLPKALRTALYWWTPDPEFIDVDPLGVIFPPHSKLEWEQGNRRTTADRVDCLKFASGTLSQDAPQAFELAKAMNMGLETMNEMLLQQKNSGSTANEAACLWLQQNENTWRPWIPIATDCILGKGLVDSSNNFVQDRSMAVECAWCTPGRLSSPILDSIGKTHTCKLCDAGRSQAAPGMQECEECGPGTFSEAGAAECKSCPAGSFGNESKMSACRSCDAGTWSFDGARACVSCKPGRYAGRNASSCSLCEKGTFANSSGSTICSACQSVLEGSHGYSDAASSPDDCKCMAGTYFSRVQSNSKPVCISCQEGFVCNGGNDSPLQDQRFQAVLVSGSTTDGTAQYSVYRCRNSQECPAGELGSCAPGRTGIGCGNCLENHYTSSNGRCKECEGVDFYPIIVTSICLLACLFPIYLYARTDVSRQNLFTASAFLTLGQLVCTVQVLSVFNELDIDWPDPVNGLLDFVSLFALDLDVIKVQCLFGKDDPVVNFASMLMLLPGFMVVFAIMVGVLRLLGKQELDADHYFNAVGLVALSVFIAIAVTVLRPFHCIKSPNATSSMASNPAVVCWDSSQHRWLVALGIIGLIGYPVTMLAVVAQVTIRYPFLISAGSGLKVVQRYRFLFVRFAPSCYFWGCCYCIRNLFISLAPVLSPESAIWQVVVLNIALLTTLVGTARLLPWRTQLANISEIGANAGLVLFMQVSIFLVDVDETEGKEVLGTLLMLLAIIVFILLLGTVVFSLYRRLVPQKKYYVFLCHHKEGAGSLARYTKRRIEQETYKNVFLDSDQLEELDLIFNIVRADSKNLVILLTKMTLMRPWCAGEITTAKVNDITIVPVVCNDYAPPTEQSLAELDTLWSEEQKFQLATYGINMPMIKDSFRYVGKAESIELNRFAPVFQQEASISKVVDRCGAAFTRSRSSTFGQKLSGESSAEVTRARIVVTGCAVDAEAICTTEVLRQMVQKELQLMTATVHNAEDASKHLATTDVLLVVLTRGLLHDSNFREVLVTFASQRQEQPVDIVTVLADSHFAFPGPEIYAELQGCDSKDGELETSFRKIFNILALPFSPLGSWGLMSLQASEICRRLRHITNITEGGREFDHVITSESKAGNSTIHSEVTLESKGEVTEPGIWL